MDCQLTIDRIEKFRYARWSLGFVDPPLEISGTGNRCKITALNARGKVLLQPVMDEMNKLLSSGTLSQLDWDGDVLNIQVVPPSEVGTFSEEERSRQVCVFSFFSCFVHCLLHAVLCNTAVFVRTVVVPCFDENMT